MSSNALHGEYRLGQKCTQRTQKDDLSLEFIIGIINDKIKPAIDEFLIFIQFSTN